MFKETTVLIVLSRILEFFGIIAIMFLMFKGYKLKYVYIVGGVVVLSISLSVAGLLVREYFTLFSLADLFITLSIIGGVILYVIRHPEKTKDFTPPEECRCGFCNAYIVKEDELCTLKVGPYTYFFESCDHMVKFLQEAEFMKERHTFPKGGKVKDAFVKTSDTGNWKKLSDVYIVKEGDTYKAYEKKPQSDQTLNTHDLIKSFEDKIG